MTSASPRLSCALPPTADVVARAGLAEDLGYHRVWLFDSPALFGDLWVALGRVAAATRTIRLGVGVTVPGLRHPMVTASAIASVAELAPGRLVVGIGTGATARFTLGLKPARWSATADYYRQVRALLDGRTVDIDGRPCRMMQLPGMGPERPVDVPLWLAVSGPKGVATAIDLKPPGVIWTSAPTSHGPWTDSALLRFGTVLDPGESHTDQRVLEAAGPGYAAIALHAAWEQDLTAIDQLPGGAEWRTEVEAELPPGQGHLAVHEGHLVRLTDRDRPAVAAAGPGIFALGWNGDASSLRDRIVRTAAAGVTEIVYVPAGPDPDRELRAFAAAMTP
ncbi:5,10-methylenetetrahydromethanopterin reductase [Catenulispora sp. EB89]|uniref:LLM class flavin-dependent oxidoreductase n=1 Tax=Catenulispora sp. EB89 TaxID=3156257 RepID=UPI00351722FC